MHFDYTGIVGIEPTPTVLETVVLPLNYIPKMKICSYSSEPMISLHI